MTAVATLPLPDPQSLFSVPVGVGHADPRAPAPPLWPGEACAVAAACPARRREFAAGRGAARRALAALGLAETAIAMGSDRAPVWPAGVVGSITHTDRLCLAAVSTAPGLRGLGLDAEPATPLEPALWPEICTRAELRWLDAQPAERRGVLARALFCAKEAAYKAQYPVSRALFGFHALELQTDLGSGRFVARFCRPVPGFAAGDALDGRLTIGAEAILAGAQA